MEERTRAPDSKQRSNYALVVLFLLGVILLTVGIVWVIWQSRYNTERVVIPSGDGGRIAITIFPDNRSTRAAAQYLAYAVEQVTGTKAEIKAEKDDDVWNINIVCDPEVFEQKQQRERAKIIVVAEAAFFDDNPYALALEKRCLNILIPEGKDCFGAVKAVTDRWLQTDCGITGDGELVISRAMIDEQLARLPTEITGQIRILTQNLRNRDDGEGRTIEERAARFFKLVEEYQPDLIGTQEATWQWMELLEENLSDRYELFGCSRLGPDTQDGEWNTILYRKDRFLFIQGDTFWLSNTPAEPATKLNYEGSPRICTWLLLQDSETGNTLLFSNTHLHHPTGDYYRELRARQAEILLQKLHGNGDMITKYPGFLTGDFNGPPDEPFYLLITGTYADAQTAAITNLSDIDYTFHNYGESYALIDFCFYSPQKITVLDYRILNDQYGGYVSDHYGVLVTAVVH